MLGLRPVEHDCVDIKWFVQFCPMMFRLRRIQFMRFSPTLAAEISRSGFRTNAGVNLQELLIISLPAEPVCENYRLRFPPRTPRSTPRSTPSLHCTMHNTAHYFTTLHNTAQHCTTLQTITALHYFTSQRTTLHKISPRFICQNRFICHFLVKRLTELGRPGEIVYCLHQFANS